MPLFLKLTSHNFIAINLFPFVSITPSPVGQRVFLSFHTFDFAPAKNFVEKNHPGAAQRSSATGEPGRAGSPLARREWERRPVFAPRRARSDAPYRSRQRVLDCGGKRSATPLSHARKSFASMSVSRPPESAVAAPALPAQSKTLRAIRKPPRNFARTKSLHHRLTAVT